MTKPAAFRRFIGIDYSGAATPDTGQAGLRVYRASPQRLPQEVTPVRAGRRRLWTRRTLAHWLADRLAETTPTLVGIDHAFSFPLAYFDRHGLTNWDHMLADFVRYWPTHREGTTVQALRAENPRHGSTAWTRLAETWVPGPKSAFQFDVQGAVAKSTHAGLPWLHGLRHDPRLRGKLHFWPYDGMHPPAGISVIAEVFPSLMRRRYRRGNRTVDQQDAYCVARWMADMQQRHALWRYLNPPLTDDEHMRALLEGWILGVG